MYFWVLVDYLREEGGVFTSKIEVGRLQDARPREGYYKGREVLEKKKPLQTSVGR